MDATSHIPSSGVILHIAWVRWWSAIAYHAFCLAKGLDAIGVPSRLVAPPGSPLAERAEASGLSAPRWVTLASARPDRFLRSVAALRRAVSAGSIRGVFAHTGIGHTSAGLALLGGRAPLLRVRADIRPPSSGWAPRWLYTRATDRILISGDFMRRTGLETLGVEPGRIVTLPAGIEPASIGSIDRDAARDALRAGRGWPPDAMVVGMLARYSPVKGHADLVTAARFVRGWGRDARFFVAGPAGQTGRARVEAWVRRAGLEDRFAVLDQLDDPLATAAGFDIAVIASRGSEAVCRSALEYMALGLPVIATRVNAIPETVGDAGVLVEPESPEKLGSEIMRLMEYGDERRRLGEAALRRVREEFDSEKIARRAAVVLEEAERERSAG